MTLKITTEDFIKRSRETHGNKYDYTKSIYKGSNKKIIITCPVHGDFEQNAYEHSMKGQNCLKCRNQDQTCTTEDFIIKARLIHGELYNYDKTIYINKRNSVIITCKKHGDFKQIVNNHLLGKICKKCSNETAQRYAFTRTSFTRSSPTAILYTLKCFDGDKVFYKIGITTRTVEERYRYDSIPYQYEVIEEIRDTSNAIYDLEKKVHKLLKDYSYIPSIKFAGYTECFKIPFNSSLAS